uniref:H15 domain-containing protein n=1 Tax=Kalanchoe fedtschenkoi TaxID=63787 RepID=A0A7N0RA04_KALFE
MAKESAPASGKEATHPSYLHMITEALTTLKERTGSSVPAMAKFLEQKYGGSLPVNFRKTLTLQLKRLVKSERLVKVKNSFKLAAKGDAKDKPGAVATGKKGKGKIDQGGGASKKQTGQTNNKKKSQKIIKASEAKKVVAKALKTKRLSQQVKKADGMKKRGEKGGVKGGGNKTQKADAPGKSTRKKPAAGASK